MMEVLARKTKWRWAIVLIGVLQIVDGSDDIGKNGCDRYVDCRNELLEMHWRCAEVSRRTTQHACKIMNLFGQHKSTSYEIEQIFSSCTKRFSALSDIDLLMEIEPECSADKQNAIPSHYTSANCWSELIRMTQKCFALSRCCPSSQRCYHEVQSTETHQIYENEKTKLKGLLENCVEDMESLRRTPISRDDGIIAMKVNENARELLKSVVPFRIFPDPQLQNSKRVVNAAPTDSTGFRRPFRRPLKHRYGISKQKFEATVIVGKTEDGDLPLTTSLSPFTSMHAGYTNTISTTQTPAFFSSHVNSIDFESKPPLRIRKNKKRRFRKRKITKSGEKQHFQRASVIEKSHFDAHHAAVKLDKLSRNLRQKGEYGRNFLPKMLLVKQNKGKFLGYAQPFVRPIEKSSEAADFFDENVEKHASIDQIYDDIIESQKSSYPPTTLQIPTEASWTRQPPQQYSNSHFDFTPTRATFPTVTSTTSTTTTTQLPPTTVNPTVVDPLVDYITHELLEKHLEKESNEEDFDFSANSDYIDISADVAGQSTVSNVTVRTTATPLIAAKLGEQNIEDLIPLPHVVNRFGTEDITPSPFVTTTELNNQLWPIPIRKVHRLKMMGQKVMQHMRPIVILPINKKNAQKMNEYKKRKLLTGCQRYDKCLRKEVEMRMRCAKPYPQPFDRCSAQLLPLYRLIDEASNDKLQYFIKCISKVEENISRKCLVHKPIDESEVTCDNIEVWTDYCKSVEKCCESKHECENQSENSNFGNRLRLLEKSFTLRAAACQFKHAFHRNLVKKS
ncbi:unnamed protein product [Caenorhabditis angaria]|uniref:Chondroitin proteoglycan 4 domain-containing protein n=1 Tax=Caenorhabditis angaria TaxID=860376 RepID=A0A9P1IA27_9PELO|nr:unnamed protein product [Caenorhabditis angaria]